MNKNMSTKEKIEYFWMYYKLHFIAVVAVILIVIYFANIALTSTDNVLDVMLIDSHAQGDPEELSKAYMETREIDDSKYDVQISTSLMFDDTTTGTYSMTSKTKFITDVASELLDVCGMLKDDFMDYDDSQMWLDLRDYLTENELSNIENELVETDDGRVIGILANNLPVMQEYGCYSDENGDAVIGIVSSAPHKDEAIKFLLYIADAL